MGSNPINLGFRFLFELISLAVFGYWGWTQVDGPLRFLLAILLPLLAAVLWGTFAVLDDPSRSGKAPVPVPGWVRLILELVFFGLAVFMLFSRGFGTLTWIFGGAILLHYLLSYDRIIWLLQQKAQKD